MEKKKNYHHDINYGENQPQCTMYTLSIPVDKTIWLDVSYDVACRPLVRISLLGDDDAELVGGPLVQPHHLEALAGEGGQRGRDVVRKVERQHGGGGGAA